MSDVSESSGARFGSIGDRACEKNSALSCTGSHGSPCQTAHYDDRLHPLSADGWRALVRIREREIDDATRALCGVLAENVPPFADLPGLARHIVDELLSLRHDVADLRGEITTSPISQEAAATQAALQAEIDRLRDELKACEENWDYVQERAIRWQSVADALEARACDAEKQLEALKTSREDLTAVLGAAESLSLEDLVAHAIDEISSLSEEIDSANEALRRSLGLPDTNTERLKDLIARVSTALTNPSPAEDEARPVRAEDGEDRIVLMRDQLAMLFLRNATAAGRLSALLPFDLDELPESADALTEVVGRIEQTWREREERIAALGNLKISKPSDVVADPSELLRLKNTLEDRDTAIRMAREALQRKMGLDNSDSTTLLGLIEKAPIGCGWAERLREERAEIRAILIDVCAEQNAAGDRRDSTWELAVNIRYMIAEAAKQLRLVLDSPSGDRSPLLALTEEMAIRHARVRYRAQRDLAAMKQAADKRAQDLIDAGARAMVRLAEAGVPTSDAKSLEDAAFATGKLIADLKSARDQIARRYASAAADAVLRLRTVGVPASTTASLEDVIESACAHIRNLEIKQASIVDDD